MNRRMWLGVALILAATAGVLRVRSAESCCGNVDSRRLVAQALSRERDSDYIAHVTTTTGYNGRVVKTHATVFHQGKMEKIEYAGASAKSAWSMARDGKTYTYLPKDNRLLVTEMSRVLSDADRTELLLSNFRMRCARMDAVAGRKAYVVELASSEPNRPWKKLWIDCKNQTILRTDDYSASGEKRGSTEMDSVSFGERISPKTFALPSGKSVKYFMLCESGDPADTLMGLVAMPTYIPSGYRLEGYHVLFSTCGCSHRSSQLTYTDGLNMFSVFQAPRMVSCCKTDGGKCDDQNCGIATQGQVTRGDREIVVVGDLLPKEIRKIAESVR